MSPLYKYFKPRRFTLKEDKFVSKNIHKWQTLEAYNKRLSRKGIAALNQEEIKEFTGLYRNLSHNLAYSKANFPKSDITVYLNQLIGLSHNYIFVREEKGISSVKYYITQGLASSLKENRYYFWASLSLFMAGFIFCLVLVLIRPEFSGFFFPGINANDLNLDPQGGDSWVYPMFASFIMTNNIRVSFMAFALGITAGIGTVYVLFYNGMVIGALSAVVISGGASQASFWAMILPHGFIELTAIFISGACGLMIGKAILTPGRLKRKDSTVKAAKKAAYFIPAIVIMLVVAGIIEGYFTPLNVSPVVKIMFAFVTLFMMIVYYIRQNRTVDLKV
jgi:uncharacterized membrane protein SpoIIM required for sporulation